MRNNSDTPPPFTIKIMTSYELKVIDRFEDLKASTSQGSLDRVAFYISILKKFNDEEKNIILFNNQECLNQNERMVNVHSEAGNNQQVVNFQSYVDDARDLIKALKS